MSKTRVVDQGNYFVQCHGPVGIDVNRGGRGKVTVESSRPFRVGGGLYCADFPHTFPTPGSRSRVLGLSLLGREDAIVRVVWS